jgi:lysophospholipase L1-like esterase
LPVISPQSLTIARRIAQAGAVASVLVIAALAVGAAVAPPAGSRPLASVLAAAVTADPAGSPAVSPSLPGRPWPSPAAPPDLPPLPSLLGAIGDSFTQGFDISPSYKHHVEYPQYSWVVGWARGDGVFSLRERFEALGARPVIVDVAKESRKMSDAPRQARLIVEASRQLLPGQTAFVTIELGTNDLCYQPKTSAEAFESQFRSAMEILQEGLPVGSRILVTSVPDLAHIHGLIQGHRPTRLYFQRAENLERCAPFAGSQSPMSYGQAVALMDSYNASLARVCGELEATYGPANVMHCASDTAGLAESDFTIDDISTADHFHFAFSGQDKMAEAAWRHMPWASLPLPVDAQQ